MLKEVGKKKTENDATNDTEDESSKPPPLLPSKRFLVIFQMLIAYFNMYGLRANMSIAMIEMTSNKTIVSGNRIIFQPAEFNWSSPTRGNIFNVFAYGYFGALFGGVVSSKFGAATTLGMAILLVGLITTATPIILNSSFYLFLISRGLVGLFESFAYASSADVFSCWTSPKERSSMVSFSANGSQIGTLLIYPICGYIAHKLGWPSVFYVTGIFACATSTIFLISVKNHPSQDTRISRRELNYLLQESRYIERRKVKQPWKRILTSKCVWALCLTKLAYGMGFSLLVLCFPLYVKDMTNETTDKVGFISTIPYIISTLLLPIAGRVLDYIKNNCNLTSTTIHKFVMSTGYLFGALLLLLIIWTTNFTISMTCFVIIKIFLSFNYLNIHLISLEMAPNHSSTIFGCTSVWYTIGMVLVPTLVGQLVNNHSVEEWNKCFLIISIIWIIEAIHFIVHGSSEPQPWSTSSYNIPENNEYNLKIQTEKCLKSR